VTRGLQHVGEEAFLSFEIEQHPDLEGRLKFALSPQWLRVRL